MSKRVIAIAIAVACTACGGSDTTTQTQGAPSSASAGAKTGNSEPEIVSATLSPDPAGASDALSVDVNARDPERHRLRTTIEWYRNGVLESSLTGVSVDAGTFNRGDRVYAVAHVSDGAHEVSKATNPVTLGNALPKIGLITIGPAHATAADVIEAQVQAQDPDGDSFELSYRWLKNGQPIEGATEARLAAGRAHRGDKLVVEVSANDGSDQTPWVRSGEFLVANAEPVITSQPGYEMGSTGVYTYEISAKDADGDQPLRYELVSGPAGMAVDDATGAVTWNVPQDAKPSNPIEVAVSDGFGGRTTQRWVLSVDWNQAPAAPAGGESAETKRTTAKPAMKTGEQGEETKASQSQKQAAKPQRAQPQRGDGDDLERSQEEEYRQEKEEEF